MNTKKPQPVAGTHIVVMGVSGCGKTTVGALVADGLGLVFLDGDSLHPLGNITKMASGTPLNDNDRWPWLAAVGAALADSGDQGIVIACSALKRSYRDAIRHQAPNTIFLHLHASKEVLGARLEDRSEHFMPAILLESQFATLESLDDREAGLLVDISGSVDQIVTTALDGIKNEIRYASA